MPLLLAKLALAPALVVCASVAGRRWGPAISGVLVALPIVAGPVLLIIDLEHGVRFAAHAAASALVGLVALVAFTLVFARISRARGWTLALAGGWLVFIALALALSTLALAPLAALGVAVCAFALGGGVMRAEPRGALAPARELPGWDLPARAAATAVLVLSLTGAASALGPARTGVLTPFPVAMSVLLAFVLAQQGRAHSQELLRAFLRGGFGFVAFCFLLAVLLVPAGTAVAFALALCGALAAQLVAQLARRLPARELIGREDPAGARA